jgi:hypothetical protein
MKTYARKYPQFALCGLNCVFCPKFNTDGSSKCPGCGGPLFNEKHPSCGVISCSLKHNNVEFCFECSEYPCKRYQDIGEKDSFVSYKNVLKDFSEAKKNLKKYLDLIEEKRKILKTLLENYNDGRMKSFYCNAVNTFSITILKEILLIVEQENTNKNKKEIAKKAKEIFIKYAAQEEIILELRK